MSDAEWKRLNDDYNEAQAWRLGAGDALCTDVTLLLNKLKSLRYDASPHLKPYVEQVESTLRKMEQLNRAAKRTSEARLDFVAETAKKEGI